MYVIWIQEIHMINENYLEYVKLENFFFSLFEQMESN